ncbi:MAG: 3-methyl-2-oxobutanoate dehydrogenase subunit VorB [SAR324 cluster bacterium]|uniref:3-methyl-2-oxobutanoate dehydrogenase subunit VorB n=1 Tax=SAR324 cluster bacterium TaxID=2024889 RepID=A0A7X9ILI2_9DELT|nr:3-methyl-2-oxobutanoate dehydrogenase subunit VorB [SAR324 cluster bacterium]
MPRELMKGNYAMAEAAVRAGLEGYFGYPITPQTEILEYLSKRLPELGRVFIQAESEVAAINMVYGAACTGARIMTTSSGPGVSLMAEGMSYIAGSEIPMVLGNVMRGGPGLGNIAPSQSDYNQMVHGAGHGDYHQIVLAPAGVQETIDLTVEAFDLAEQYRSIVIVLIDGTIGQMMEPAELPPMKETPKNRPDWAIGRFEMGEQRLINSFNLDPRGLELMNIKRMKTWLDIKERESRSYEYYLDDSEFIVVAFGTAGRVCLSSVQQARKKGIKVGLFRPITLSPFPCEMLREASKTVSGLLVVEMNAGQMLLDVRNSVGDEIPLNFYGRVGGLVPYPGEILAQIEELAKKAVGGTGRDAWERWMQNIQRVV